MNETLYEQPKNGSAPMNSFAPEVQSAPAFGSEVQPPIGDGVNPEEMQRLAQAIAEESSEEGYSVSSDGTIHLAGDVNDGENMTKVANKPFGAPNDDDVEKLAQAFADDNTEGYVVAPDGSIHLADEPQVADNSTFVAEDPFGAPNDDDVEKLAQAYANDNTDGYVVAPDGSIHLAGEVSDAENMTVVAEDPFGAPNDDDVEKLAQAYANDNTEGYVVAPDGSIHLADEPQVADNSTFVAEDPFGAPNDDDVEKLAQTYVDDNTEDYEVDPDGTIHLASEVADEEKMTLVERVCFVVSTDELEQLDQTDADGNTDGDATDEENTTVVASERWGVSTEELERVVQAMVNDNADGVASERYEGPTDKLELLAQACANDNTDGEVVGPDGSIHLASEVADEENMTVVAEHPFAAPNDDDVEKLAQAYANDNTDGYVVAPDGSIHLAGEVSDAENMTVVAEDPFGAHEDQWYKKNPRLLQAEIAAMHMRFPKARHGFYPENGNMYWLVKVNVFNDGSVKPWTFQLVYDKDHPHKRGYGGSLKVKPIVPSLADLETIAKKYGRPGVPHVIRSDTHFLKRYLCTRWPDDISTGISAVQATAWAVDWAAHFEVGMRNKKAWNKWCDDDHFRHLQLP